VVAALLTAMLAGCGADATAPAWASAHPDTSILAFHTSAPGVCAITVQYPDDAPAAVTYLGGVFVQVQRRPRPTNPAGHEIDHSGDWHVVALDNGDLLILTPGDAFDYRREENC
jgi:hypothetical protein